MGKQNNVTATFYGKVGQVVGQRYRDKNVIRTYVVPRNPRTPAQQGNREIFRKAAKLASFAMSVNYKAPCWYSPSLQEYAQRASTANIRIRNSAPVVQTLPIIPAGYNPQWNFTDLRAENIDTWNNVSIRSDDTRTLTEQRKICVVLAYQKNDGAEWDFITFHDKTALNSNLLVSDIDQSLAKPFKLQAVAVSTDDVDFANQMVYWQYQQLI